MVSAHKQVYCIQVDKEVGVPIIVAPLPPSHPLADVFMYQHENCTYGMPAPTHPRTRMRRAHLGCLQLQEHHVTARVASDGKFKTRNTRWKSINNPEMSWYEFKV